MRDINDADEIAAQLRRDAQTSKAVTTRRGRVSKPPA